MAAETMTLVLTIGGTRFTVTMPRADTDANGVELRYLIAMERWLIERLCANDRPSGEAVKFLRQRSGLKEPNFAQRLGVTPEEVSAWETGTVDIPAAAWRAVTAIARERLRTRAEARVDPSKVRFVEG